MRGMGVALNGLLEDGVLRLVLVLFMSDDRMVDV